MLPIRNTSIYFPWPTTRRLGFAVFTRWRKEASLINRLCRWGTEQTDEHFRICFTFSDAEYESDIWAALTDRGSQQSSRVPPNLPALVLSSRYLVLKGNTVWHAALLTRRLSSVKAGLFSFKWAVLKAFIYNVTRYTRGLITGQWSNREESFFAPLEYILKINRASLLLYTAGTVMLFAENWLIAARYFKK